MDDWIQKIGTVAAVVMPIFNIPMILHLVKTKSSKEISLTWILGVWVCIVLMTPQALKSQDVAFRAFGTVNLVFFSVLAFLVLKYRRGSTNNS